MDYYDISEYGVRAVLCCTYCTIRYALYSEYCTTTLGRIRLGRPYLLTTSFCITLAFVSRKVVHWDGVCQQSPHTAGYACPWARLPPYRHDGNVRRLTDMLCGPLYLVDRGQSVLSGIVTG